MTKYWMALSSVAGVGSKTVQMLVSRFGSPKEVFSAPVTEIARMPRLDLPLAREILDAGKRLAEFERFIAWRLESGIQVLCPDSHEYPDLLKITADFPPILYKSGAHLPKTEPTVAIVGTRSPTFRGLVAAEKMAEWLVRRGVTVISGLARGVDTAAHRGALKGGGKTVAVLGSGLKVVYPRENYQLANDICVSGAIISECHPNEGVSGRRLIQRNRIISGLSLGLILVEPERGSLNAARWALRENRRIFLYGSDSDALPPPLSEAVSIIYEIDGLDTVMDRLYMTEKMDDQMDLL